jgi:hypothetical protein
MTKIQILIYCSQFLVLSYFILNAKWFSVNKQFNGLFILTLFFISCLLSLANAYAVIEYFKSDVLAFLNKGNILYTYLKNDVLRNFDFFFEIGGGMPPKRHYDIAYNLDMWCHPSSFLMIKIYGFFGAISSFHLANISLFFAFLSFVARVLLLKIFIQLKVKTLWIYIFLLISFTLGTDAFFINGLHKESLGFFLYVVLFYLFIQKKTPYRFFLIFLLLFFLIIVRNYLFIFFFASLGIFAAFKFYKINRNLVILSIMMFVLIVFSKMHHIITFVFKKVTGFKEDARGKLKIIPHEFDWTISSFVEAAVKGWKNIFFYIPQKSPWFFYDPFLVINNCLFVIIILFLLPSIRISKKRSFNFYYWIIPSILGLQLIGLTVYNYGTILRYRSLLVFFIIIGLLINQKKIEFRRIFKTT